MTKVDNAPRYVGAPQPGPVKKDRAFFVVFWRSAVGKKWVMAVTGLMMIGFVVAHMVGNLKIFISESAIDHYAEWLRTIGYPILPETGVLWLLRVGLVGAVVLHISAATSLTRTNHAARPTGYKSPREYVAADFAARTMRWTGVIVTLFIIFHLLDLTWGRTGADHVPGNVYQNIINSFTRVPVAIAYIIANIAIAFHLYHGAWSMFQSLGINSPRFNPWRRSFAVGVASIIAVGNISIPVLVVTGVVK